MLMLEAVRITEAPSIRSGRAFCTVKSTPFTLRPNVSLYCSSVIDPKGSIEPPPALTNSTSLRGGWAAPPRAVLLAHREGRSRRNRSYRTRIRGLNFLSARERHLGVVCVG